MPAIYAGRSASERASRARAMLARLGLSDRLTHTPGELSGGQQQRVSIARALINGADVVLADEPTGALDSATGREVLQILSELNAEGRTIVIVTHSMKVAEHAERIIELRDGLVVSDRRRRTATHRDAARPAGGAAPASKSRRFAASVRATVDRLGEALRMALLSMNAHRLRTVLTMLGIVIGVASVVCVVALGTGSQRQVLANISNLGTNTLEIFPGRNFGDARSGRVTTLVVADVRLLKQQYYVAAATPTVSRSSTLRSGALDAVAQINGVGEDYFAVRGTQLVAGSYFDADSVRRAAQDVVIDENAKTALFPRPERDPLGEVILIGRVPCRIVGVIRNQQGGFGSSANPSAYLPYTTVQSRFIGTSGLRSISVRVADDVPTDLVERAVTALLERQHGAKDFFILNTDDIRRTVTGTAEVLTILVAAIAAISLLVGGIGVMNIMLVSVTERVGEIGVRMAVGARRSDILAQFLIEAVLVCVIGGAVGVALALGFGAAFSLFGTSFQLIYSPVSILVALGATTLIGIVFGYVPARNASLLDPIVALARE